MTNTLSYNDYTGRGFNRFKRSLNFNGNGGLGRGAPRFSKAEIAAFSEITKVLLLMLMAILAAVFVWWDVKIVGLLTGLSEFSKYSLSEVLVPALSLTAATLMANYVLVCMWPRAVFIIKNFKAPK